MQPHKNKVIETNNAKSRKHTHTHANIEVKTMTETERYNERERRSFIFCEEWGFEWRPFATEKENQMQLSDIKTHTHSTEVNQAKQKTPLVNSFENKKCCGKSYKANWFIKRQKKTSSF